MILDVFRAMGRRWYIVIAGLLATVGLAYGAYGASPPEYSARGLVLLLPSEASVGKGGNPFLNLAGLEQPAGIVVAYFSSTTWRDEIAKRAPDAQFLVAIDDSTRGPVVVVDVTDKSATETLATLKYITDQIPIELARLQQEVGAPQTATITSMPLVVDTRAEANTSGATRLMIAAAGLGVVLTGIVSFAADGMLSRRQGSRRRRAGNSDSEDSDSESDSDTETDTLAATASPPEFPEAEMFEDQPRPIRRHARQGT